jgi:hypothetical protein
MKTAMVRFMNVPINWKVVWTLLLTPAAGCLGYVLLIAFSLVTYQRLPIVGADENWKGFFALAFLFAATIGGVIAAPVTLAVLPIVRCRRPGRDKISFFALAFAGLISGFLSPVVMTAIFAINRGSVIKENLEVTLLMFGSMGAGSGVIMAVVWFFLTQPPTTLPPMGPIVGDSVASRSGTDAQR